MKYSYHGQVLDHVFLDATVSEFWKWAIDQGGWSWYGQHALVEPDGTVVWMDDNDLNVQSLTSILDSLLYEGVVPKSLGEIKASFN